MRNPGRISVLVAALLLASACSQATKTPVADPISPTPTPAPTATTQTTAAAPAVPWQFQNPLPGMPPVIGGNVYSQDAAGMMRADVAGEPAMLYVPNSTGTTVTVIDQRTRQIVRVLHAGDLSQHVVPDYHLNRFYVTSSVSNQLVGINPHTGRIAQTKNVPRPYNLYFTPDGKAAIVMVEQYNIIRFSNPKTFASVDDVSYPGCHGPNHADFSANGQFFVVTCEFSGELLKIATTSHKVLDHLKLGSRMGGMGASMPQDVRLSPDGTDFYVADMGTDQLRIISAKTFKQVKAIPMPSHPHGIYPSRDGKLFYVSDRGAGEVSVVDPYKRKIVATWRIPGGGSPDMGGVSADGSMLWLAGRYNGVVYGFNTRTGKLVAKIYVGGSPHGLLVWPQPGRYSLGHTGNLR